MQTGDPQVESLSLGRTAGSLIRGGWIALAQLVELARARQLALHPVKRIGRNLRILANSNTANAFVLSGSARKR